MFETIVEISHKSVECHSEVSYGALKEPHILTKKCIIGIDCSNFRPSLQYVIGLSHKLLSVIGPNVIALL